MKNIISKVVIVAMAIMIIACPSPEDTVTIEKVEENKEPVKAGAVNIVKGTSSSTKVESEKDKQERLARETLEKAILDHINEAKKLHVKLKNANGENEEQIRTTLLDHIKEAKKGYDKLKATNGKDGVKTTSSLLNSINEAEKDYIKANGENGKDEVQTTTPPVDTNSAKGENSKDEVPTTTTPPVDTNSNAGQTTEKQARTTETVNEDSQEQAPTEFDIAYSAFIEAYDILYNTYDDKLRLINNTTIISKDLLVQSAQLNRSPILKGATIDDVEDYTVKLNAFKEQLDNITIGGIQEEPLQVVMTILNSDSDFLYIAGVKDIEDIEERSKRIQAVHSLYYAYANFIPLYNRKTTEIKEAFLNGGYNIDDIIGYEEDPGIFEGGEASFIQYSTMISDKVYSRLYQEDLDNKVLISYTDRLVDMTEKFRTLEIPSTIEEGYLTYPGEYFHPLVEYVIDYDYFLDTLQDDGGAITLMTANSFTRAGEILQMGFTGIDAREAVVDEFYILKNEILNKVDAFSDNIDADEKNRIFAQVEAFQLPLTLIDRDRMISLKTYREHVFEAANIERIKTIIKNIELVFLNQ